MRDIHDFKDIEGSYVPRRHAPGIVVLSFIVCFIGSWTTLELFHKRTHFKGWYNWGLLSGCALSMGGMAIWCMRFIGNRAIILGDGEPELQPMFSAGMTALSFFLPVIFTEIAFAVVGPEDKLYYMRVALGSTLAGLGYSAAHYGGQAQMTNYDCFYDLPYVLGAIVISVVTNIAAVGIYVWMRSIWNAKFWLRGISAFLMAGAVSGMYWVASIGTFFRLKKDVYLTPSRERIRDATTVIVVVLSILGCFLLIMLAIMKEAAKVRSSHRAQQVVLATAVFDEDGRLMVTAEGVLPNRKITNSYLEQGLNDTFNNSHPTFQWILRTTHNWKSVEDLVPAMRDHLVASGLKNRFGSESNYTNDEGTPIKDYQLIFRELFCTAAADLADDLHQPLNKLGIIFDNIISTDQKPKQNRFMMDKRSSSVDLEKEGIELEAIGKGQLLFLVRKVTQHEADSLQGAGYRFADIKHLIPILGALFRIRRVDLAKDLEEMYLYTTKKHMLDPGIHLGFFCARASVAAGFEILARRDARYLLPTMQVPLGNLEEWQIEFLKSLDAENVSTCLKAFNKSARAKASPPIQKLFASQLRFSLEQLKDEIDDSFFNDARFIGTPVEVPCRGATDRSRPAKALLFAFRMVAPLQARAPGKKLEFTPLVLFKTYQHVYKNAVDHAIFARQTYQEFSNILDLDPRVNTEYFKTPLASPLTEEEPSHLKNVSRNRLFKIRDRLPFRQNMDNNETLEELRAHHLGGIMVSRQVSIKVVPLATLTQDNASFIEEEIFMTGRPYGFEEPSMAKVAFKEEEVPDYAGELLTISMKLR